MIFLPPLEIKLFQSGAVVPNFLPPLASVNHRTLTGEGAKGSCAKAGAQEEKGNKKRKLESGSCVRIVARLVFVETLPYTRMLGGASRQGAARALRKCIDCIHKQ